MRGPRRGVIKAGRAGVYDTTVALTPFSEVRFRGHTPTAKAVWLLIALHPGAYSYQGLADELGVTKASVVTAVNGLLADGLLERESQSKAVGRQVWEAGRYRAALPQVPRRA